MLSLRERPNLREAPHLKINDAKQAAERFRLPSEQAFRLRMFGQNSSKMVELRTFCVSAKDESHRCKTILSLEVPVMDPSFNHSVLTVLRTRSIGLLLCKPILPSGAFKDNPNSRFLAMSFLSVLYIANIQIPVVMREGT